MDIARLGRSTEYYEALEKRIKFNVTDGGAHLIHVSGVSFGERQAVLKQVKALCSYEETPPVELRPDPDNPHDKYAVEVWAATARDDLTTQWVDFKHLGYIPRMRCPECCASLYARGDVAASSMQICNKCDTHIGVGSAHAKVATINKYIGSAIQDGRNVRVGLDNITQWQGDKAAETHNAGCDLWLRVEE